MNAHSLTSIKSELTEISKGGIDGLVNKQFKKDGMQNELQDILASMVIGDKSSLDIIRNNALTFGGVFGAETEFITKNSK